MVKPPKSVGEALLAPAARSAELPDSIATANPLEAAFARLRQREAQQRQLADCEAALQQKPGSFDLLMVAADLARKLQRNGEAAALYARALAVRPERRDLAHLVAALGGGPAPARADDTYVATLFDAAAEKFDETLVGFLNYRVPELVLAAARQALGEKAGGQDVIDLGCGTGLCGPLFRPLARRLDGVDLSAGMVAKARARRVYDDLAVAEIGAWAATARRRYTLALAADVLVYFGDLATVFAAVAGLLGPAGRFIFTVEVLPSGDWNLGLAGRYAHGDAYVRRIGEASGFEIESGADIVPRHNDGKPVVGRLYVLRKRD